MAFPKRAIFIIVGMAIVLGLGALTVKRVKTLRASASAKPETSAGVPVETVTIKRGKLSSSSRYVGTLVPEDQVMVATRISGRIVSLPVEEGAKVKRGDLLARLDDEDLVSKLAALKVRLRNADTNLRFQQDALDRINALYAEGAVPRNEVDRATLARDTAQANRDEVAFTLAEAEAKLLSPVDGEVSAVLASVGDMAMPGKPIVTVVSSNRLTAQFKVFEQDLLRMVEGQKVRLQLPDGTSITGAIGHVDPTLDQMTRSGRVEVPIDDQDVARLGLRVGMSIEGAFIQAEVEGAILVPKNAVVAQGQGGSFVYVVREGKAARVPIKTGLVGESEIEVKEGLKEGDRVMVSNLNDLYEGRAVLVQEEGS